MTATSAVLSPSSPNAIGTQTVMQGPVTNVVLFLSPLGVVLILRALSGACQSRQSSGHQDSCSFCCHLGYLVCILVFTDSYSVSMVGSVCYPLTLFQSYDHGTRREAQYILRFFKTNSKATRCDLASPPAHTNRPPSSRTSPHTSHNCSAKAISIGRASVLAGWRRNAGEAERCDAAGWRRG